MVRGRSAGAQAGRRESYNTVQVSGTKRSSNNWQARLSYAYSRGRGSTATGQADTSPSQFLGDLNLRYGF